VDFKTITYDTSCVIGMHKIVKMICRCHVNPKYVLPVVLVNSCATHVGYTVFDIINLGLFSSKSRAI